MTFSNNKQCFYLPGGKVDNSESATEALCREAKEELQLSINANQLRYYTHIPAPAYGESNGIIMEQDCFFLTTHETPVASAEIGELRYFSLAEYLEERQQAPGAVMILEQLQKDNLID